MLLHTWHDRRTVTMATSKWRRMSAFALVALVAACGGGDDGKSASSASSEAIAAQLKIRDEAARVRERAGAFAPASDGQDLAVGDTVRTNGTGFVQVDYPDGSLTRLDSNAEFTLVDLSTTDKAQRVTGKLDGGRAWSNVEKITSSTGRYELETPVATASVRGTQFDTDCTAADDSCTFTVIDGTVAVTPTGGDTILLQAGEALTVTPDGNTSTPPPATPDPWISKNTTLDRPDDTPAPGGTANDSSRWVWASYTGETEHGVPHQVTIECRPNGSCRLLPPGAPDGQEHEVTLRDGRFRASMAFPCPRGSRGTYRWDFDLVPSGSIDFGDVSVPERLTGTWTEQVCFVGEDAPETTDVYHFDTGPFEAIRKGEQLDVGGTTTTSTTPAPSSPSGPRPAGPVASDG
jgi:hypothetical protein